MTKRFIAKAMLVIAACTPLAALAMQNEPEDFLGVVWGAAFEKHRADLRLITQNPDSAHYRRLSDRPFFAGIEVRRISYYFYKDSFTSGTFLTVGTTDLNAVLAYLNNKFGPPAVAKPRHRVYAWEGERIGITVSCDITISCYTEFYDRALRLAEIAASEPDAKRDD